MPTDPTKLVVGLGNPGASYRGTRHNAGSLVVQELVRRHKLTAKNRNLAAVWEARLLGAEVTLAQPKTYMNLSGRAVTSLRHVYNIRDPVNLLVVYDELDLPLGALRLRDSGGSGGHNGMRSIIEALGTEAFPRLRIGIGRPPPGVDPVDYVLTRFGAEERALIERAVTFGADAVECWIEYGPSEAMNRFNRAPLPGGPEITE